MIKQRLSRSIALTILLVVINLVGCSKQSAQPTNQTAKPLDSGGRTYRALDGHNAISLVSSTELEVRSGGENLVCKYTKSGDKLRVVVNMFGTTTAQYFSITPQGLVDEQGAVFYDSANYQKITAQSQLNRQLLQAVESDDSNAIDALIHKGANIETHNESGSLLLIAASHGLQNAVTTLLKNGATPNSKFGNSGLTPLESAVNGGYTEVVALLLKGGAKPNVASEDGRTPLMIAAGMRNTGWAGHDRTQTDDKIVSILCENGANLDAVDKEGNTALATSLIAGNLEATKILVAAGADRNIGKESGHDAYTCAQSDEKKMDALQTAAEREARDKIVKQYPNLLVGAWRDENSVCAYNPDGTETEKYDNGRIINCKWSLEGNILTHGNTQSRILQLDTTNYVSRDIGGGNPEWHASRITEERKKQIAQFEKKFLGSWHVGSSIITYTDDKQVIQVEADYKTLRFQWSLDDDILVFGRSRYRIIEVTDSTYFIKGVENSDGEWRGTKVTKEEIAAAQAKDDKTRRLLEGTWLDPEYQYGFFIFKADGTMQSRFVGNTYINNGKWAVDGNVLTICDGYRYKVTSVDDKSCVLELLDCVFPRVLRMNRK